MITTLSTSRSLLSLFSLLLAPLMFSVVGYFAFFDVAHALNSPTIPVSCLSEYVGPKTCPLTVLSSKKSVLRYGSRGARVSALQEILATDSSLYPEGLITGYFGKATEAAVMRFQKKYNIVSSGTPVTTGYGVVGPKTSAQFQALLSLNSNTTTPTSSSFPLARPKDCTTEPRASQDACWQEKARSDKDVIACTNIRESNSFVSQDQCIGIVARERKDASLCNAIQNPDLKQACVSNVNAPPRMSPSSFLHVPAPIDSLLGAVGAAVFPMPIPESLSLTLDINPATYTLGQTIKGEGSIINPSSQSTIASFKAELFKNNVLWLAKDHTDISVPPGTTRFSVNDLFGTPLVVPNDSQYIGSWTIKITQTNISTSVTATAGFEVIAVSGMKELILANKNVAYTFAYGANGLSLATIKNKKTGFVVNNKSSILWSVRLRDRNGSIRDVLSSSSTGFSSEEVPRPNGKTLVLSWKNIPALNSSESFDVTASVDLDNDASMAAWRVAVTTGGRLSTDSIWNVAFPIVAVTPLRSTPKDDFLWLPGLMANGALVDNPATNLKNGTSNTRNPGPSQVQFVALYDNSKSDPEEGFYFATQDSRGYVKDYRIQEGSTINSGLFGTGTILFGVEQYPENMLSPGINYQSPYATVFGPFSGDWYDAAKMYRSWALLQPWASRGPLISRPDVPSSFKNLSFGVSYWPNDRPVNPASSNLMSDYKTAFDSNAFMVHWNNWFNGINLDTTSPDWFPARGNYLQEVDDVHKNSISTEPYINGRLWRYLPNDPNASWVKEGAETYAIHKEDGSVLTENYSGMDSAVMDPSSTFWQDKLVGIVDRLVKEYKSDGVYMDQLTLAGGMPDFSPRFGGRRGGGSFFTEGVSKILQQSRAIGRNQNKNFFVTSEGQIENYIGDVDRNFGLIYEFLRPKERAVSFVSPPVFDTIYHDYARSVGGMVSVLRGVDDPVTPLPSPLVMSVEIGLNYMRGNLFATVEGNNGGNIRNATLYRMQNEPQHNAVLIYLQTFARVASTYAQKYLTYGELLRPLKEWEDTSSDSQSIEAVPGASYLVPKVLSSVWKANDGTHGIVLTNYNSTSQTTTFTFKYKNYNIPAGTRLYLNQLSEDGSTLVATVNGDFSRTLTLAPYSVVVLELSPRQSVASKTVFLSSQLYTGNLGGLSGADAKCQALADGVPSLRGKRFKAWLSDSATSARDRLTHATTPYKLFNGTTIASDWDDLVDGTIQNPINRNETGALVQNTGTNATTMVHEPTVWTGTKPNGTRASSEPVATCRDYTSTVSGPGGNSGRGGYWTETGSPFSVGWTTNVNPACDWFRHMYCIEQ